jgi:shikimate dehydrogenase
VSKRFVVLGHPVSHSLSPAIHGAAYAELGLPYRYELRDAPDEAAVEATISEIRSGALSGSNVTVPWKQVAVALADRADASAGDVGAANTLVPDGAGAVVAHNTDVGALAEELTALGAEPQSALVIGAGGAALAAVAAARRIGAKRVIVSARRFDAATSAETWPNAPRLVALGAELRPWPTTGGALVVPGVEPNLVIQATSAGMTGAGSGAEVAKVVPWRGLAPRAVAYDVIYNPRDTEFLQAARSAGVTAQGGLGMLVVQAALALELWLGVKAPRARMLRAAEEALRARSS